LVLSPSIAVLSLFFHLLFLAYIAIPFPPHPIAISLFPCKMVPPSFHVHAFRSIPLPDTTSLCSRSIALFRRALTLRFVPLSWARSALFPFILSCLRSHQALKRAVAFFSFSLRASTTPFSRSTSFLTLSKHQVIDAPSALPRDLFQKGGSLSIHSSVSYLR